MKALSLQQPWAWLILHGGKDIENRTWSTRYRGPVLIHASRTWYTPPGEWASMVPDGVVLPEPGLIERGGIVGQVEIVDCVKRHPSRWFFGPYGFVLRNPIRLPFRPCRGALGFFDPEAPPPGGVQRRKSEPKGTP
jgi:hypothetical protein